MSIPTLSEIEEVVADIAYGLGEYDWRSSAARERLLALARRIAVETERANLAGPQPIDDASAYLANRDSAASSDVPFNHVDEVTEQ